MGSTSERLIPTESYGNFKISVAREIESRQVVTPTQWCFKFQEERAATEVRQSADVTEVPTDTCSGQKQ